MRLRWLIVIVLFTLCARAPVDGAEALSREQAAQLLSDAQAAYARGIEQLRTDPDEAEAALRESADRFRALVDSGIDNGRLHYNLGNALLQSGDLGESILHYLLAQTLEPSDPRIGNNLAYARSLRRNQIEPEGQRLLLARLTSWHRATSLRTRVMVFVIAYVIFWMLLAARALRPSRGWRWPVALVALVWIVVGASVALTLMAPARDIGVLVQDDVVVRKGNGIGFDRQFEEPLHEGVEFEVLERRADWLHVELPNGSRGWVPAETAVVARLG